MIKITPNTKAICSIFFKDIDFILFSLGLNLTKIELNFELDSFK